MADHVPVRNDDVEILRKKRLAIPEMFARGCFTTSPVGAQGGLGPSATELLLWLPLAVGTGETFVNSGTNSTDTKDEHSNSIAKAGELPSIAQVRTLLGGGTIGTCTVPTTAIDILVSPKELEGNSDGARSTIRGTKFPVNEFGNIFWKPSWAIGTRNGILVRLLNG